MAVTGTDANELPLAKAVEANNPDAVKNALERGENPDSAVITPRTVGIVMSLRFQSALAQATETACIGDAQTREKACAIVNLLCEHGADPLEQIRIFDPTALGVASEHGWTEGIEKFEAIIKERYGELREHSGREPRMKLDYRERLQRESESGERGR